MTCTTPRCTCGARSIPAPEPSRAAQFTVAALCLGGALVLGWLLVRAAAFDGAVVP